ncbi:major facilitator superfamily domain-containing protein 1-like isoform X1 [Dreissena polymorpha]|nr:major facilitator superfamily domain-containing protein 1-like isoform X1 [Dreissena polymorpha]XP_052215176.1 major facilitator superfamily domain-containing protein 1-like isoform X2 [Dreissena polymorpha]XP_052215177.1 major facilitator superfamily domain-containing protein 1-like isoform X1 [Dreissena polymorpha]XP_052215178.1 major facilitator superfamily domain-containing protein 1-like isoform X3 [Dreissena polymorpha]XP_052215181.1 major facilitator superfamily domain-containing prot
MSDQPNERTPLLEEGQQGSLDEKGYKGTCVVALKNASDNMPASLPSTITQTTEAFSADINNDTSSQAPDDKINGQLCLPSSTCSRYTVLVFICLIGMGDYWCNDSPASLQNYILSDMRISQVQYMGFYSTIQWASILSCLIGGFMVDKVGIRASLTVSAFLLVVAHTIFALGAMHGQYWVMWASRALFGFVEGPVAIANDNMAVKWFRQKELNMVMGLKISAARLSSVLTINVMVPIYEYFSNVFDQPTCLGVTLLVGSGVALVSAVSAVILSILDRRADTFNHHHNLGLHTKSKENVEAMKISDVKHFSASFWLISVTTAIYYLQLMPFVAQGQVFFETKYGRNADQADNINSMVYLLATITMPIFGLAIDKVGKNMSWMLSGIILSLGSHVLLAFTYTEPYICVIMLGIGYSLYTTAAWPLVSRVVPQHNLGTAYGLVNTVLSLGQAADNYLVGYIVDTMGYLILEVFFITCSAGALITAAVLYTVDSSRGGGLNLSRKERLKNLR